ncbi:transporter substrate-binding domain-containing protein [Luteolibacter pohnpeiensis]|uniref:transporter substrate-binding domain-containing protein n=1 Tax=Luteolibacter pohnpeiensis TaxID=454153 RepID=UPI002D7E55CF|nr:transporter substrate-binding domain-containing protein [Luteolibacter pohnpeiensis]
MRQLIASLIVIGALANLATAQDTLKIGTREAPPFAMKDSHGNWTGLSIDLWKETAGRMNLDYEFQEMPTPESLVDGVRDGKLDASIAAITVTADRAQKVDFTHPYFNSGLGIVVPAADGGGWFGVAKAFFSLNFLKVLGALSLVLLAAGIGVWLFERKKNPEQFGGTTTNGLGSAFWWSAVTMTTVGYGDKSPQTLGGRLIGLVWMFTSVIIISGFTAQIASSLTVNRINTQITGPADLARFRIATVSGSIAEQYLSTNQVPIVESNTIQAALEAVKNGKADACVYDSAILNYELRGNQDLTLLPSTFDLRDYAIALPLGSPLRKQLNITLLEIEQSDLWTVIHNRYIGTES